MRLLIPYLRKYCLKYKYSDFEFNEIALIMWLNIFDNYSNILNVSDFSDRFNLFVLTWKKIISDIVLNSYDIESMHDAEVNGIMLISWVKLST